MITHCAGKAAQGCSLASFFSTARARATGTLLSSQTLPLMKRAPPADRAKCDANPKEDSGDYLETGGPAGLKP
jgi:hypothetical protein